MAVRAAGAAAAVAVVAVGWIFGLGTAGVAAEPLRETVTSLSPADMAALGAAPTVVELTVIERLDPADSHIVVVDGDGRAVPAGEAVTSAGDTALRLPVEISGSGDFAVAYHVTFIGGNVLSGSWRFSVGTGVPPATTAGGLAADELADVVTGQHAHGVDPVGATLLVINVLVVLVVLILLRTRPRTTVVPHGELPASRGGQPAS